MFAETRADWMITAYGCFQHSMTLVTLYTNEDQLSAITRGDLVKGVDVEGDTELLKILARCFDGGANVHQIRVDQ